MFHKIHKRSCANALKVDGPSTASILAKRTGQAVGNASHHLKVLAAAALALAREAEVLQLRRQVERVQQWMANADSVWDDAAFATQNWLTLSPEEMYAVAEEIMAVLKRWGEREIPEDGAERESCIVFARGFPAQP